MTLGSGTKLGRYEVRSKHHVRVYPLDEFVLRVVS
jgi:hypothetical protein